MIKQNSQKIMLLLFSCILFGCASDQNIKTLRSDVNPLPLGYAFPISARDLVLAMKSAGFNEEEILKYGPDLRNAIGTVGGAQIQENSSIEAMFSMQSEILYITSRQSGTFLHRVQGG